MIAQDLALLYLEISTKGARDDIVGNSRIPRIKSRIPELNLEFLEIASVALLPRNDENSRIPYRDPPKGLGDDREF